MTPGLLAAKVHHATMQLVYIFHCALRSPEHASQPRVSTIHPRICNGLQIQTKPQSWVVAASISPTDAPNAPPRAAPFVTLLAQGLSNIGLGSSCLLGCQCGWIQWRPKCISAPPASCPADFVMAVIYTGPFNKLSA